MTIFRQASFISVLLSVILLPGCGGAAGGAAGGIASAASGGSGGGIGGTGLTSSGTIDGFGSIFVNGIEFETGSAEILVDGERVGEEALGLGMVVLVTGEVNQDGTAGNATRIVFDDEVQGPVTAIERDVDGDSLLITVLGIDVIVERTGTVFAGVDFRSLALGDVVEVSGFAQASGRLRATRVEKKDEFLPGVSEVDLKGVVGSLTGTEFTLRGFTVDFSAADLARLPGGSLANGLWVEVIGTLDADIMRIRASRVEPATGVDAAFEEDGDASVQGFISSFVSRADFRVSGVPVDASSAVLQPSGLPLMNGAVVEVEGDWVGGILRARRVEGRRGRVEIEAGVAAVDSSARTVTMQFPGGAITIGVDRRTMLDDETGGVERLRLSDLRTGDFLGIEALQVDGGLVATRIDRDGRDENVLQAPLEAFGSGDSITLLGITFSTAGAEFRGLDEAPLSPAQFYSALAPGMLVKVRDRAPADGIADRVELEYQEALDGDRDFDEPDDVDDDSDTDEEFDEPDSEDEADEADDPDEVDDPDREDEADEVDDPEEVDEPDEVD